MTDDIIDIEMSLAFNPISNYEFSRLNDEDSLKKILRNSHLYMICHRSELIFQNVQFNSKRNLLEFEIEKKGKNERLKIVMDIYQESLTTDKSQKIHFKFYSYHIENWKKDFPYNNVRGFQLHTNQKYLWFSPDRLLWSYFHNKIKLEIFGDYTDFITFKVNYVGESTKQNIADRLRNHHKRLKIISEEKPSNGMITNETIFLLFEVKKYDLASKTRIITDMDNNIMKIIPPDFPDMKVISLDAEKAITRILKPEKDNYTEVIFKSYPKSDNGLYKFKYNNISYYITDNLFLEGQNEVKLKGNVDSKKADKIVIQNHDVYIYEI